MNVSTGLSLIGCTNDGDGNQMCLSDLLEMPKISGHHKAEIVVLGVSDSLVHMSSKMVVVADKMLDPAVD